MKLTTLKMAVLGALMLPTMSVIAEEAATAAVEAPKSDFSVSGNVGIYSDYIFRGYTQTENKPALQGGFDVSHSSGLYAGVWASNVDWTVQGGSMRDNSVEIDLYAGFAGEFGKSGLGYDVGVLQFLYPGKDTPGAGLEADATEVYVALSYDFGPFAATLKNYTVVSSEAWAFNEMDGENYTDLSIDVPVGDKVTLSAHVGHQTIGDPAYQDPDYTDWKLNAEYAINDTFSIGAFYTDTDMDKPSWTVANTGTYLGDATGGAYLSAGF